MRYNSFFKQILLVVSIVLFVSCDKEYNSIGADLLGDNHFALSSYTSNVVAYNQKITSIESKNLPVNALGIYDNPAFGKTTANFATQLILSTVDPVIGDNPVIDNVILDIPYFTDATKTVNNTDGSHVYTLDSIYGEPNAKIKLSIYESGYFMRDLDPIGGFQTAQKYFTDQNSDFENLKIGNRLNDTTVVAQNDEFFFNPAEHSVDTKDATTGVTTTTRAVPSMKLNLNRSFFKSKIIDAAASGKLLTNDIFKEYFRGLYFKVEQSGTDPGSLAMMNFSKGTITINYKEDLVSTTGGATTRVAKTIVLNMTGNTVSLLNQSNTKTAYSTATSSANTTLGDEKLFVKGGEGSMAVISLFDKTDLIGYDANGNLTGPNGVSDELDNIRKNGWLINEANLVFNIDTDAMANSYEPQRIYLFDLTNNRPVIDYYTDASSGTSVKKNKTIFDGNINLDATSKRGKTYKIRITDQIRGLVKNADSTNVKLGIVVTEDIATANSNHLRTAGAISQAPKASVMNPLGTILYGSAATVPEDKRLKLEIYYTKPN
ncbi:MAG: DUF4270 domain-containing protein [Flavobacterium sp.]|uniref:DUF4270 domain-containing protein n=1 Tax=Flavobacterium sp. TaxID=239 RepID=UPI002617FF57|nr:DUF4270 domain-containing protein [Flavobacterium sp.]MDD5149051.1 DUF4270 domain-containing protein [Flavobacterium sp.]